MLGLENLSTKNPQLMTTLKIKISSKRNEIEPTRKHSRKADTESKGEHRAKALDLFF